jgi:hypothetical protein
MTIDPTKVTNFDRSTAELQAFWLFCLFVTGSNSDNASGALARLLSRTGDKLPFDYLRELGSTGIYNALVVARVGQYMRRCHAIEDSFSLDLRTAKLEDLTKVFGIGPKTARFFLTHTRPNCEYAVLDTHVLSWMRDHGVDAPQKTPTSPEKYLHLEKIFLSLAKAKFPLMSMAQIDLLIWATKSGRIDGTFNDGFEPEPIGLLTQACESGFEHHSIP